MKIIIFSDLKTIETYFTSLNKSRNFNLLYHGCCELEKKVGSMEKDDFIYIDISGYGIPERKELFDYLSKLKGYRYGIIDPDGVITDPAVLIFGGASDYLGSEVLKKGITSGRVKKAAEFYVKNYSLSQRPLNEPSPIESIPSGGNWSKITPGKEYTFCLMYIELDKKVEMRKRLGEELVQTIADSFKKYIIESITSANGRMWIWNNFEGLILFPFNGKTCDAILACFRMILYRKMMCAEKLSFNTLFTFRIALHIGNTVYERRGNTNKIISNSLNTIFHLGRKYTDPGNFFLTKEVYKYSPKGLKKYFLPAGQFENYDIMRMKLPL